MSAIACAAVLKALSHPTRIAIVSLLSEGDLCVCEILEKLGTTQPALSKHLSVLRAERLVSHSRQGNRIVYRLASPQVSVIVRASCQVAKELLDWELASWERDA